MMIVDGLQYVNWNRALLEEARDGGVNAIHVTIAYWENTRETLANIGDWHRLFREYNDLITPVRTASDVVDAGRQNKVGIIFGFQNCSPIEDDLRLVQVFHELGVRIMQLSYNNQSLLATGCYESDDPGITRFGKEVIREMNRVGMLIDMSHSAERSTLEAIDGPRGACGLGRHARCQPVSVSPQEWQRLHAAGILRNDRRNGGDHGHRARRNRLRSMSKLGILDARVDAQRPLDSGCRLRRGHSCQQGMAGPARVVR
jgi:hypothetical protein